MRAEPGHPLGRPEQRLLVRRPVVVLEEVGVAAAPQARGDHPPVATLQRIDHPLKLPRDHAGLDKIRSQGAESGVTSGGDRHADRTT